jgi:hypothetical protein
VKASLTAVRSCGTCSYLASRRLRPGTHVLAVHLEQVARADDCTGVRGIAADEVNTARPPSPQTIALPSTMQERTSSASIASAMNGKRSAKLRPLRRAGRCGRADGQDPGAVVLDS